MILTSGAFDGLTAGHVAYLRAARGLCDAGELLYCAVAPDSYIKIAKKRPPLYGQAERIAAIEGLRSVDVAISHAGSDVAELIMGLKPRLFVKGIDWNHKLPVAIVDACCAAGTLIAYTDTEVTHVEEAMQRQDGFALDRLQSAVRGQHAPIHWKPVTDFTLDGRREVEGQHAQLIKDVFEPVRVLDAGAGPGHLMTMLHEVGIPAVGVDNQPSDNPYVAPFDLTWPGFNPVPWGGQFDLVICREVLEHMTFQGISRALHTLTELSSRYLYITTRFAKDPAHVFDVDLCDNLDPTHISMLTQPYLRSLLVLAGMSRRKDMEARLDWKGLGRVLVYEWGADRVA